jgi:hypothetical protein
VVQIAKLPFRSSGEHVNLFGDGLKSLFEAVEAPTPVNARRPSPGATPRKSLSLPTQAMMKSWPWAACFASARFAAGLGNQSIFPPWRRCRRVDVSYFAQIPDGQRRRLTTIETPSQSVRSLIQAEPGTPPGVRGLAPKHVGRKDIPCKYLQSFKENR